MVEGRVVIYAAVLFAGTVVGFVFPALIVAARDDRRRLAAWERDVRNREAALQALATIHQPNRRHLHVIDGGRQ